MIHPKLQTSAGPSISSSTLAFHTRPFSERWNRSSIARLSRRGRARSTNSLLGLSSMLRRHGCSEAARAAGFLLAARRMQWRCWMCCRRCWRTSHRPSTRKRGRRERRFESKYREFCGDVRCRGCKRLRLWFRRQHVYSLQSEGLIFNF